MARYVSFRREVNTVLQEKIELLLSGVGEIVAAKAKMLVPVDTGRLRNSIEYAVDRENREVMIGTNVEYALSVEAGSGGRRAKPYLKPSMTASKNPIQQLANMIFRGL